MILLFNKIHDCSLSTTQRDSPVRNPELSTDDTRPDSLGRQLHDLQSDVVGEWSPVDEHAPELVHATLA